MKKTLIAVAALAATSAFAQVTLSGSMQVGLVNSGADGASTQVTHLGNGANAINMAAMEEIGKGLRAGFDAQIRFNAERGDVNSAGQGAALFHNLNTYISGAFGTARIGKIVEASNCAYDPWACGGGAALMAGPIGVSALIGAGAQANSIAYTTPTMMGFTGGLQKTMSAARGNERSVAHVNYANGPLTAQVMVTSGVNVTAAQPGGTYTGALDVKNSQTGVAASYDFKVVKVNVANVVTKNQLDQKHADVTSVSAVVPLGGPLSLLAGYNKSKTGLNANGVAATAVPAATSANDTKYAVGVNYALSRRTTLGADLFKAEGLAPQGPATGTSGMGYVLRVRHTF